MPAYLVTQPHRVRRGTVLKLSKQQLAKRAALVRPAPGRKGWHEAAAEFEFKAGEQVELADEMPKGVASLQLLGAEEAPAKPAAAAANADAQPASGSLLS